MSDRYLTWVNSPSGSRISKALGLAQAALLDRRGSPQDLPEACLLCSSETSDLHKALTQCIAKFPSELTVVSPVPSDLKMQRSLQDERYGALLMDASGIDTIEALESLHHFFHRHIRQLGPCGRVLIIARPPEQGDSPEQQVAQRALEGFIRSLGKELRHGGTAHLIYVAQGAEEQLASTVQFCCSVRSAYVSAQTIRLQASTSIVEPQGAKPLAGKNALVTGASRGIGAAISQTLAIEGAEVIGLDVPQAENALHDFMRSIGGKSIALDITEANAPAKLIDWLKEKHGGIDIFVHNAGVTRDKMLANMPLTHWQLALNVNLLAPQRINEALLHSGTINNNGRIIGVSSISGIAGNLGQTNYATSKAGVIGLVDAYAPLLRDRQITVNAVAPGFIETEMTAKVPFILRQLGRRMNSLKQGGLPVDVAETIAWIANPASSAVNGNTIRVCGQSLLGA